MYKNKINYRFVNIIFVLLMLAVLLWLLKLDNRRKINLKKTNGSHGSR